MKVERITLKDLDGRTESQSQAVLIEGLGIEGDLKANGGERQISLLPLWVRERIEQGKVEGLCVSRFRENITWSGEGDLVKGGKYKIGEVLLEISELNKKCFDECYDIVKNAPCPLTFTVSYAIILRGGVIKLNDEIQPLQS
jgi:MOSC domain-containing protein YiiM